MAVSLDTITPLSYNEWLSNKDTLESSITNQQYNNYLTEWYQEQSLKTEKNKTELKNDYLQLVKDLSFLFGQKEKDQFLSEIDYTNDEELIFAIPFFAKKLKEIAIVLSRKREAVKEAKLRYNLIGSNNGLEKLLYEYLLRGFTNTENSITQVPASPLIDLFPDLSAVKDNFFIEIEELHDPNSYFDSDPSVSIEDYVDIDGLVGETPFEDLTEKEIIGLISTRYLPTVAPTTLSNSYRQYIENRNLNNFNLSLSSLSTLTQNEIEASIKYLGQTIYGLTAIRLKDIYRPDEKLTINFPEGNTWFLWPSGDRVLDNLAFINTFDSVPINESNFLNSGATAGSSYDLSDLIFTEKNNIIQGAWLNSIKVLEVKDDFRVKIERQSYRDFVFPFAGFNLTPRGNNFDGFSIRDDIFDTFNNFDADTKKRLLESYYTTNLPNTASLPIYLNQTNLVDRGAYANFYSDEADVILKKKKIDNLVDVYSEEFEAPLEAAYLYKFQKTNLAIDFGVNNIYWPISIINANSDVPITIKNDTCLPIALKDIEVSKNMLGAIAGRVFGEADIIYKMSSESEDPVDAAWLASPSITDLDLLTDSIPVYDTSAVRCSQFFDGPVQLGLSLRVDPSEKISFVWGDRDTPADEVFKFIEHSEYCPYHNKTHDYYTNLDFLNKTPLTDKNFWNKCTCKSVYYSPVGHISDQVNDYNMVTDFIFADPDGVGVDFSLNSWKDTRNLPYDKSPQFAHYKLDGIVGDTPIGWGKGKWKTGDGSPFILKTGRRYTYSRTSFRKNKTDNNQPPFYVTNYDYKKIIGNINPTEPLDLILAIDVSKSQTKDIGIVKQTILRMVETNLKNESASTQIGLIIFGSIASFVSFLSREKELLSLVINGIQIPPEPTNALTNIYDAMQLAYYMFTYDGRGQAINYDLRDLCSNLNFVVANPQTRTQTNVPNPNAKKKMLFFTNGIENLSVGLAEPYVEELKKQGVEFFVVDVGQQNFDGKSLSKTIASSKNTYFDLRTYLRSGEGNVENFGDYLSYRINGLTPIKPAWNKAIRNQQGNWIETNDSSDMVLYPGDFLIYVHRDQVDYTTAIASSEFSTPSIGFTIDVKLEGWDYTTNTFSITSVGKKYGAKPFWGKMYTDINVGNNFNKYTKYFGGNIRFFQNYVPIMQPEISQMVLESGDFIRYKRFDSKNLNWTENLTFNVTLSPFIWKKLKFNKEISNLKEFLNNQNYQYFIEASDEPSDITLESYSSFNPAYYNYYARGRFTYNQDLFYRKRCEESFVVYNTAAIISPSEPYANLLNVFYPTIAAVSFPSQSVTKKQMGEYLLPNNLGISTYRGKGYSIEINNDVLTKIDSISAERTFLSLEKYGPRQRNLTKKDQISPVKITTIDNTWIYEPFGRGKRSGIIFQTKENQKFTPYQTTYEIEKESKFGISKPTDMFQFWTPPIPATWNQPDLYPLTFRKELLPSSFEKRKEKLLVNQGYLEQWRTDIFGNDYGLYKTTSPDSILGLDVWFSSDYGVLNEISPPKNATNNQTVARWLNKAGTNSLNSYSINFSSSFIQPMNSPVLITDYFNGSPAIYFDGTNAMHLNYNLNTEGLTIFIVGQFLNVNTLFAEQNYQPMLSISLSSQNDSSIQTFSNETFALYSENGNNTFGYGNSYIDTPNPIKLNYSANKIEELQKTNNKTNLFEFSYRLGYSESYINKQYYLNSIDYGRVLNQALYSSVGLDNSGGLWIGSYGGGQYPTQCAIFEIIVYNRYLTNKEKINIRDYIYEKYNL